MPRSLSGSGMRPTPDRARVGQVGPGPGELPSLVLDSRARRAEADARHDVPARIDSDAIVRDLPQATTALCGDVVRNAGHRRHTAMTHLGEVREELVTGSVHRHSKAARAVVDAVLRVLVELGVRSG